MCLVVWGLQSVRSNSGAFRSLALLDRPLSPPIAQSPHKRKKKCTFPSLDHHPTVLTQPMIHHKGHTSDIDMAPNGDGIELKIKSYVLNQLPETGMMINQWRTNTGTFYCLSAPLFFFTFKFHVWLNIRQRAGIPN